MAILRAWWSGVGRVARAPLLVAGIHVVSLGIAVPLGAALHEQLPDHEARLAPPVETPLPPDADWLDEVSSQAGIFSTSLVPSMIGAAAPIVNLTAFIDGRGWPLPGVIAAAGYYLCWTWLWGGVLARLGAGKPAGLPAFIRAATSQMPRMLIVGLIGLAMFMIAFFVVQPVLFGALLRTLSSGALERTAFAIRALIALAFVVALVHIAQAMDCARIAVAHESLAPAAAVARGFRFARARFVPLMGLAMINGLGLILVVAAYGATEFVPGGSVPRLLRVIMIGQAYLIARLAIRLAGIGGLLSMVERSNGLAK